MVVANAVSVNPFFGFFYAVLHVLFGTPLHLFRESPLWQANLTRFSRYCRTKQQLATGRWLPQPQLFRRQFQVQTGRVIVRQNLQQPATGLLESNPVTVVAIVANVFPALPDFFRRGPDFRVQAGIAERAGDLFQLCGSQFIVEEATNAIFAIRFDAADQLLQAIRQWLKPGVPGLQLFQEYQAVMEFSEAFLFEQELE